jgi:hypothetical protein
MEAQETARLSRLATERAERKVREDAERVVTELTMREALERERKERAEREASEREAAEFAKRSAAEPEGENRKALDRAGHWKLIYILIPLGLIPPLLYMCNGTKLVNPSETKYVDPIREECQKRLLASQDTGWNFNYSKCIAEHAR